MNKRDSPAVHPGELYASISSSVNRGHCLSTWLQPYLKPQGLPVIGINKSLYPLTRCSVAGNKLQETQLMQ